MRRVAAAIGALAIGIVLPAGAGSQGRRQPPRLIALIVVDQFRADYIDRFQHQWTRGLRRLIDEGAWFRRAEYPYFNTQTCPGHASVSTGAPPALHGIILNNWWDRETARSVTCTEDESVTTIGYGKALHVAGESAKRLRLPTLADELRAQLSPPAHIVAVSLKARSAIMLGGRRPDAVAWFDDSGAWATSTAFSSAPVPAVADYVDRHRVEDDFGKVWDRSLPRDGYRFEDPAVGVTPDNGGSATFPHVVKGSAAAPDAAFYLQWQASPFADEYVARMALDVARRLHIGDTTSTDLLGVSFSVLDKVGHDFGPNSHEIQDVLVRLDRTLGEFFATLDRTVGSGQYTVALTADHGVAPLPERMRGSGLDAGRLSTDDIVQAVERSVGNAIGPGRYVANFGYGALYLAPGVYAQLRDRPPALARVVDAIRALPGVLDVYTRDDLSSNRFGDDAIGRLVTRSFDASRSGDLTVVLRPYWLFRGTGADHGTGYGYDTRVPFLLMGKGVVAGEYLQSATPLDVAPTLAFLAGVTLPRVSGRVLVEAVKP